MRIAAYLLVEFTQLALGWQLLQTDPGVRVYRLGGSVSAPSVLTKNEPTRTDKARAEYISGTEFLELVVNADGSPRNIVVRTGLGYGLEDAAVECVRQWRFKPGMKDGVPVNTLVTVEINFPPGPPLATQDTGLPAPVLLSPPDGQVFSKDHLSITLDWQPSAFAVAWVVERDFGTPEKWASETSTIPGHLRFTKIPKLAFEESPGLGKERWRVWPLNYNHERGLPSEWRVIQFAR